MEEARRRASELLELYSILLQPHRLGFEPFHLLHLWGIVDPKAHDITYYVRTTVIA
jgi:hypothetical protein